jgi:nucleotide-binding universal stress UspA family protein
MITFQRILFPVDFSERTVAIVPAVKALAKRFGSEIVVLHIVDLPPAWSASPEASAWSALINADGMRRAGRASLDRFVAKQFSDMDVIPQLDEGIASQQIVDYAHEDHADLIMMPTSGYGPFRRLLIGSVTAKVLHDAHCPVWTGVHAEQLTAHSADRWKRMLCAVDTNERDVGVLHWAAEFASEQAVELRLVHAVLGADPATKESDPAMHEFLFNIARERIDKLQAAAGTKFEVCLLGGNIGRAVHQAASGHDSDLIVIGRGVMQKPLGRLRSSTYSIIREAPCPVMSI